MENEKLGRLEIIIEKLLSQFGSLKEEKEKLKADLLQKEREITELQELAAQLKEEKSVIHGRVSSLISSLERWEETQTGGPESAPPPVVAAAQQELRYPEPPADQALEARG